MPGDLHLSGLDPHRYWSDALLHRSARYDGLLRWDWVAATLAGIAALVVLVRLGPRLAAAWELGRVGTGVMVGAVATLVVWAVSLPFGLVALWWGRRYGLEKQSYVEWLLSQWPALLGQVVGLTIVLTVLMLLAGRFPRWWWLYAGVIFTCVAVVLSLVLPYFLTIGTRKPHHTKLAAQLRALERKEGIGGTPIRIETVSDRTTEVNSEAVGIGPSSRVVLWDTILDGRFTPGEIRVIAAHEFGHVARRHIWKGLGWYALIEIPGFFVLAWLTARRGGMARPEVVPFALLVIVVFHLAVTPFTNAVSRRYEGEAEKEAADKADLARDQLLGIDHDGREGGSKGPEALVHGHGFRRGAALVLGPADDDVAEDVGRGDAGERGSAAGVGVGHGASSLGCAASRAMRLLGL